MAGIGEAAAIIALAQTGFALSSKLAGFLGDYRAAEDVIKSLREELEITSSTLQNLGELAEQNGLRNQRGVADTKRLTNRCNKTISDIKTILKLENDAPSSASSGQETELTRLDRMKVAFSKGKIDVPRADLARLKVDMMLLYFSLMTFKA
jgi:Fungal N-terminal domain of STAND proteins